MPTRTYTTPLPEAVLWHDLDQLAGELAVLSLFRDPEYRYAVETAPPEFKIQKARAIKFETVHWVQIAGRIKSQAGQTRVEMQASFTAEGQFRLWFGVLFLLAWPPLWFVVQHPDSWKGALGLTLFFGAIVGISLYWPVWRFRRFLVKRWQLKSIKP